MDTTRPRLARRSLRPRPRPRCHRAPGVVVSAAIRAGAARWALAHLRRLVRFLDGEDRAAIERAIEVCARLGAGVEAGHPALTDYLDAADADEDAA